MSVSNPCLILLFAVKLFCYFVLMMSSQVLKTLLIVVALFTLCWLPLQTYTILQDFFPRINE